MSTYSKANRTAQWFSEKYSSATIDPNCVVWHSTETYGWPGYSGGAMAPNYTVWPDIASKRLVWRAHFEDEESSRALVNLAGGVETNTANAIQVEMIGTCNPAWAKTWPNTSKRGGTDYLFLPTAPDWYLAGIADFVRDLNKRHGIKMQSGLKWNAYPGSYGATADRMTFAEWRAFYGHCGHQHVPENDHGDPGNFNMQRVLDLARATTTAPQEDPMPTLAEIVKAVWDGVKWKTPEGGEATPGSFLRAANEKAGRAAQDAAAALAVVRKQATQAAPLTAAEVEAVVAKAIAESVTVTGTLAVEPRTGA